MLSKSARAQYSTRVSDLHYSVARLLDTMAVAQQLKVAVGVAMVCGVAAIPLYYKSVRQKEMILAQAR